MTRLKVGVIIKGDINKIWEVWNNPEHIVNWCFAGDDWSCPKASNNLKIGEQFSTTMAARDGSMSFDLEGEYINIIKNKLIEYVMIDMQYGEYYIEKGRKVLVNFIENNGEVEIIEEFDAEEIHNIDMQIAGWQSILDRFKKYFESLSF
ncbi:MAG: SRPBCC domain-containing protein [Candidatus Gracilibacteria bacterium]|nr:SRPBCC domain-containing protein [Candidatus Gracilibacteria bacterium]